MKGYLTQLVDDDGDEIALYWSLYRIPREAWSQLYETFLESGEDDFEEYWNEHNQIMKIERQFVEYARV